MHSVRSSIFGSILLCLSVSQLFAATPPPIPPRKMPPAVRPDFPVLPHVAPKAIPGAPMTLERLERLPVSGIVYHTIMRELKAQAGVSDDFAPDSQNGSSTQPSSNEKTGFGLQAHAFGTAPVNSTLDTLPDVEPTVTAVNLSGTMWTASVGIKYPITNTPRNYFATTNNFSSFTRGELPRPAGYALSGDPFLAVNPYSNGISPKRMYCVGLLFNTATPNAPSAIGVWRSDNGGQSWAGPTIVASHGGGGYMVDKPAVTVSWHSASLGYVYVSWVNLDTDASRNPNNLGNSLWVARSTNGGLSFDPPFVIAYDDVQGPQLTVNTSSGQVTVTWVANATNDIRASYSNNYGVSFGAHEIISGGNLLTYLTGRIINGNVRAPTLPSARYNWAASRNIITWHARGGNNTTEVYYSFKPCSTNCNFFGWSNPIQLNDSSTNDQFMPAIDFNTAGNVVVPFYDRREDTVTTVNNEYHQYFAFANSSGGAIHGNVKLSTAASNPGDNPNNFIGDYQDVWDDLYPTGEMSVSSWIQVLNSTSRSEVYLSRIFF